MSSLAALADEFSPRYQSYRDDLVLIDISGLDRLLGDPRTIGEEIRRTAMTRSLRVQIGIAATRTAARLLALARPGLTVVKRGGEAAAIAPLAIGILEKITDRPPSTPSTPRKKSDHKTPAASAISAVKAWGLKTLGELAALPAGDLSVRLGRQGVVWQRLARGQDTGPLVPTLADERFVSSIELEWPIEGLEPLSFVLTRLLEPLSTRLERRDRGAAAIHVTLGLAVAPDIHRRDRGDRRENSVQHSASSADSAVNVGADDVYTRSLQLPTPMRDVRTLRTLILLDLESHPPAAAIERVTVVIDPTPGRVLQHALFTRAHPTPEQLSTLLARLHALMGEDRVGRATSVDSYRPGAFGMEPFAVDHDHRRARRARREDLVENSADSAVSAVSVVSALRRCRRPVPARVAVVGGRPSAVTTDRRGFAGGEVIACAGPWRTSGEWWGGERLPPSTPGTPSTSGTKLGEPGGLGGECRPAEWNRDEWDVSLSDGAVYRVFQDRSTDGWFIDAIVD